MDNGFCFNEDNMNFLYKAILSLDNEEECAEFLSDLCTIQELKAISQRIVVAKMLSEKSNYQDIAEKTGASTATISRVNRSLQYGDGGYKNVFKKLGILE